MHTRFESPTLKIEVRRDLRTTNSRLGRPSSFSPYHSYGLHYSLTIRYLRGRVRDLTSMSGKRLSPRECIADREESTSPLYASCPTCCRGDANFRLCAYFALPVARAEVDRTFFWITYHRIVCTVAVCVVKSEPATSAKLHKPPNTEHCG